MMSLQSSPYPPTRQDTKALTQVLKVLLRVEVSSAFGVLKVELSTVVVVPYVE